MGMRLDVGSGEDGGRGRKSSGTGGIHLDWT